jgi:hypothetical protein
MQMPCGNGWFLGVSALILLSLLPASPIRGAEPTAPYIAKVEPAEAGLGDTIHVTVKDWQADKYHPEKWVLYLNGVPIMGLYPQNQDFRNGVFDYYLHRDDHSTEAWTTLLHGWDSKKQVTVALGPEPANGGVEKSIKPLDTGFTLNVFSFDRRLFPSVGLALGVFIAVILLGWLTNMLRESGLSVPTGKRPPYSLGKVQLAWWLVLIVGAYLAIGLVTWDYYHTLSWTALGLLGISTGTAVGAIVLDSNKKVQGNEELAQLRKDVVDWQAKITAGATPLEQQRLSEELVNKNERIRRLTDANTAPSECFLRDILMDANGISLHRFQIVVWSLVLGLVFVVAVWTDKAMPEFSATLLTLMGLSSGTYLALKIPEQKA